MAVALQNTTATPRLSLRRSAWTRFADAIESSTQLIALELLECSRVPTKLAPLLSDPSQAARLERCLAYGQFVEALAEDRRSVGQYGLFGTAAAIELLCYAKEAQSRDIGATNEGRAWLDCFLRTWNFFDVAYGTLATISTTKFWEQARTTLRICHAIRATAAAAGIFSHLTYESATSAHIEAQVLADVGLTSGQHVDVRPLATELVARLGAARVEHAPPRVRQCVGADCASFKFAAEADDVPEDVGSWLFLWSSVMNALLAAYRARLIDDAAFARLCRTSDAMNVFRVLSHWQGRIDPRFELYPIVTLTRLYRTDFGEIAPTIDFASIANALAGPLQQRASKIVQRLLGHDLALLDLHIQYEMYFSKHGVPERYRDEYYVVPVVPLLLTAVAYHKAHWLYRARVRSLVTSCVAGVRSRDDDNSVPALPHQISAHNGTVNLAHYRDGMMAAALAYRATAPRAWYWVNRAFVRDHKRSLFAACLFGLSVTLLAVTESRLTTIVVAAFLGFAAALVQEVVASLITPHLIGELHDSENR